MAILHRIGQTDLRRAKPGMYGDGGGLWLQITKGAAGHATALGFSDTVGTASGARWGLAPFTSSA